MQVRFYLDDDSEASGLVEFLQTRGVDVTTATASGMRGAPDHDHLEHATEIGSVICSANRKDFEALHKSWMATGRSHSGIVLIVQQRYSLGETGRRLVALRSALSAEDMVNRVEYLGNWK